MSTVTAPDLTRRRPRQFLEWRSLREWGKLPEWEKVVPGYLLRIAREEAWLTQAELARLLDVTQQAVAQAERWKSNPTVMFMQRWAAACGCQLEIRLTAARTRENSLDPVLGQLSSARG